jgi:hypothetical protein
MYIYNYMINYDHILYVWSYLSSWKLWGCHLQRSLKCGFQHSLGDMSKPYSPATGRFFHHLGERQQHIDQEPEKKRYMFIKRSNMVYCLLRIHVYIYIYVYICIYTNICIIIFIFTIIGTWAPRNVVLLLLWLVLLLHVFLFNHYRYHSCQELAQINQ